MVAPNARLLCRTNLHHRWQWVTAPDGADYERCAVCHKEKDTGSGAKLHPWTVA